MQWDLLT
jgi:WD40 repeat protein